MVFEKLVQYIKEKLTSLLKAPDVSQDATVEEKDDLYAKSLDNTDREPAKEKTEPLIDLSLYDSVETVQPVQTGTEKKISRLLTLSRDYLRHLTNGIDSSIDLDALATAKPEDYNHDPIFKLTVEKYQAVTELCSILEDENNTDRLTAFQQEFAKDKKLLSTRRDRAAVTFLKGVATVLTLGMAACFGIWSVEGQKFAEKVDKIDEISEEIEQPKGPGV